MLRAQDALRAEVAAAFDRVASSEPASPNPAAAPAPLPVPAYDERLLCGLRAAVALAADPSSALLHTGNSPESREWMVKLGTGIGSYDASGTPTHGAWGVALRTGQARRRELEKLAPEALAHRKRLLKDALDAEACALDAEARALLSSSSA